MNTQGSTPFSAQKIIFRGLALLLLIGFLVGCGQTQNQIGSLKPTPTPSPTPTPIPMVRVQIQLVDVVCNGKQSVYFWQKDKFYMMTTFVASGPTPTSPVDTQSSISVPVNIGNHETLAIPPGPLVVFDALLPLDGTIRGGFTAYNGGVSNDQIAQFASDAATIAAKVGNKLQDDSVDTENLYLEAGATILDDASQAFNILLNSDTNNITQLGKQPIEITSNGQPGSSNETLTFVQTNGPGGTWNYLIHYTITRTFMSGTN